MDEFEMPPEDDFEAMYAQELEMMNEMAEEEQGYEDYITSSLQVDDSRKHPEKSSSNYASQTTDDLSFNQKQVLKEVNTSKENDITSKEALLEYSLLTQDNTRGVNNLTDNFTEKDPSSVKKRIFDDLVIDREEKALNKRRKTTLPEVGYEVRHRHIIDPDLETIDRIVYHRKLIQTNAFQTSSSQSHKLSVKKKCNFHRRIPQSDFQALTSDTGKRIYLTVEDETSYETSIDKIGETKEKVQLLSVTYRELRNEAEKELLAMNSHLLTDGDKSNANEIDSEDSEFNESELWVNKYRPRSYLDLLSDEATNRTVLHWMKLWDKLVFGRIKVKLKEKPKEKQKFFSKFAPEVLDDFDELGRPTQKVVLLCGPPGLGKTTLAHIIANHAGYNAVEMNASDDRTVETFRTNLENATTMKSVFGADKRPNCLIIDEIDGAPAASINFLVNLLQAKKAKNEAPKKKDKFTLFRPVICICNDLYVPSLRPLRQISLVIQFPPTQSTRLAQRLLAISKKQSMKADLSVLLALCNKTENDIRSCLSVLQFVRITSSEVKFLDLKGVSVGQKDYQRSMFSVWHAIFTIPRPQRTVGPNPHLQPSKNESLIDDLPRKLPKPALPNTNEFSRFRNILQISQSCGEYDKLTQGWFENYLNMKFKHTYLEPVVEGLDWATMTDLFQKEILHNQTWSLGAYIPYSFVAYHYLFSSNNWPKLQFPNQYNEFTTKQSKTKSLLDMLMGGMSAYNLFYSPSMCLVQDILPYLTNIIQPNLRAVNVQLFSSKEREELNHLVSTMISYNLTYQQEKSLDGTYNYTLEPNVEEVVNFPTIAKPKGISYSSKQLIAREIELEKVRKSEKYFSQSQNSQNNSTMKSMFQKKLNSKKEKENIAVPNKKTSETASVPNHLQKLQAKQLFKNQINVVAKDFFGRIIAKANDTNDKNTILNSNVWFKFKEGYSNAVRRPFKVKNFFE